MSKSQLGQFYTTNYDYILQNMVIPEGINHIIEPFVGKGDLLNFLKNKDKYNLELYDIEPSFDDFLSRSGKKVIQKDTLEDPPCYDEKFVLTNPPYLARNKNTNKSYMTNMVVMICTNVLSSTLLIANVVKGV